MAFRRRHAPPERIWGLLTEESRKVLGDLPSKEWVDDFDKRQVTDELTRILEAPRVFRGIGVEKDRVS